MATQRRRAVSHSLTHAEVLKLVKDALPRGRTVEPEAVSFVNAACVAFIRSVTQESTRICAERSLKTLKAESFALALGAVGCDGYATAAPTLSSSSAGAAAPNDRAGIARGAKGRAAPAARSGKRKISVKERAKLERKQQRLFDKAKRLKREA